MTTIRTTALLIAFLFAVQLNLAPAAASENDHDTYATGVRLAKGGKQAGRLVDWAVEAFESAGLELPGIDVLVHNSKAPCDGHLGLTYNTPVLITLHLCTPGEGQGVVDRLTLVHELAHAWVARNVDIAERDHFMQVHGLESWWDAQEGWERQGVEWAAETIAWAVFDEGVRMIGEVDDHPAALQLGLRVLTGETKPESSIQDHSLAQRAADFEGRPTSRRIDIDSLMDLPPLTLEELTDRWNATVEQRNLPAGLAEWEQLPDSPVGTTQLTDAVELVATTDAGTVTTVTLVGTASGQCESYDTLLAWSMLLETLRPDLVDAIDSGQFDSALVARHGRLRGVVHLP